MKRASLLVLVLSLPVTAQVDEFELPSQFVAPDAGAVAPPPLVSAPPAPPPQPLPAPTALRREEPLGEPRWNPVTGALAGVVSGLRDLHAGVELSLSLVFGRPTVRAETRQGRELEGWQWLPTLEGQWARMSGPICGADGFCGQRWSGGLGFRAGHALGLAERSGSSRVSRLLFVGLSTQVASVSVPPAPLVPGSNWVEAVFRLRFGVNVSLSGKNARAWLVLHGTTFAEVLAFGPTGSSVQLGLSLGVAL